jgi:hypothetical protein
MPFLTISANVNNNIPGVEFNDIYLDNQNNIAMATDLQSILQECAQVARTLLGECVFDLNVGIPYEQVIWVGVPNIEQFTAALRTAFLSVPGVIEIISILVNQKSNNSQSNDMLTFNAIINTIYGTGVIQ